MYSPIHTRFLNSDTLVCVSSNVIRSNIYSYCGNDPISHIDANGKFFKRITNWIKSKVINLIDNYVPEHLTEAEKYLIINHPLAAIKVDWARDTANLFTAELFGPDWNADNTPANAFKHCLWNALMAYELGDDLARRFGQAHEDGMMEQFPEQTQMDLHNNEVGYSLVIDPPTNYELSGEAMWFYFINYQPIYPTYDKNIYIIVNRVYEALHNGMLIYLYE